MRVDTKEVVRRQLRALGNDRFELGIQQRDSGAMDVTGDRLSPPRGVVLGLGIGACMWALIGTLVLWLA